MTDPVCSTLKSEGVGEAPNVGFRISKIEEHFVHLIFFAGTP